MNNSASRSDEFLEHPILKRFEAVIGLEVHCQLRTESKLFCSCSTEFGANPNKNTCPVCLGLPGTLPVINGKAVDYALKMAVAVQGDVQEKSVFARKQYFYPDLPKGYQISQFDIPYCMGGSVPLGDGKSIALTRIHMEEDAGKSVHGDAASFVDLNRAGIPLIEIVSEPDIRTPQEAVEYLKSLRSIVRYLEISDGNMEEGSFRCDANVSIRPRGETALGTRTEIKNLNSFRNIEKAITYEIFRQVDVFESGGKVVQETLLFDPASGKTSAIRSKEDSHDYRYFPDPDLGPLFISRDRLQETVDTLPELPGPKAARFKDQYGLSSYDAQGLTSEKSISSYFEEVLRLNSDLNPKLLTNWILSELLAVVDADKGLEDPIISPKQLSSLLSLIEKDTISGKIAKSVFEIMLKDGGDPKDIVKERGLIQVSNTDEIKSVATKLLDDNPKQLEDYLSGKEKVFGFFVGQLMKAFQGKCNPKIANQILKELIDERRR